MPSKVENKAKKILFVINPISGDIDKADFQEILKEFMENRQQTFDIYMTTGNEDKKQIANRIKDLSPGTVVAAGGDGTCNMVAQLLINTNIKLGIIPLGSANGTATSIKLPSDLRKKPGNHHRSKIKTNRCFKDQ